MCRLCWRVPARAAEQPIVAAKPRLRARHQVSILSGCRDWRGHLNSTVGLQPRRRMIPLKDTHTRLLLLLLIVVGCGSVGRSQVVETSKGEVEFIGLEQWTPAMIQAKLGYSSTDALHYCAAELKKRLGFPDSVVAVYPEDGKLYTVITVVEPQEAGRVQYRPEPSTAIPTPDGWRNLLAIVEQKKFINSVLDYGQSLKGAARVERPPVQDSDKAWWHLLQQRRSEKDYQQALRRLTQDGDYRNRVIAAMILMNFADHNEAWLALMDCVRDQNPFVNLTCYQGLITLTTYVPRKVDWAKAVPSIHHILSGTNLFAFKFVLNTLTKTQMSGKLTPLLLRTDGATLVIAYLNAHHQDEKEAARQFLMQLSGRDFGYDSERWKAWINGSR